jgi:zinc protease
MKRIRIFLTAVIAISSTMIVSSQGDPNQPLPNDESVRFGVLENGMTYYIKHNQEPKERASFYIIQNVGALLEEDHQNGLAHFLEHMAFNGTEHFPDKGIIDFLERHGVAFGENINAYTGQNQTVYTLIDVPVTKPGIIDTSLLILHDWSNYLLLTEEEIDAERGVIKEEWRTGNTAQRRIMKASLPYLFPNSKFAERDVIGEMEVIENFEYDALRDFYHKWYRTDLQAIAMVGDFDAAEMEKKVIDRFSHIPPVENAPERPFYEIPDHEEMIFGLVTDREADQTIIRYMIRHTKPDTGPESVLDLREDYIHSLFNSMMTQRIEELLQKGEPPFVIGMINYGDFERGYEALSVLTLAKPNQEELGFSTIMTELERVKRYGFTQGELDRSKAEILTQWEKYYNERDKISNEEYINDYVNNYLDGDAYLSAETGYMLVQALLPTITLEDFNTRIQDWISEENQVLLITGPEGEGIEHMSEAAAMAIFEQVAAAEIEPYEEEALAESLVSAELPMAGIESTKEVGLMDAVEWKLSNGATVVFSQADFEKDQVQIRAYSKGGSSLYGDEYVPAADMLTGLIEMYGTGDFDATQLQKMLAGKNVSLQLSLGYLSEGVNGTSTPKDLETLMQLVYLYFNHPRFDKEAHDAIMSRYDAFIENMNKNPQKIMSDSLSLIMTDHHSRTRILDQEFLEDVDFGLIQEVYLDRYADAGDFLFFIVGNVDEEAVKPLVQKYIGAIPDLDRTETWVDREIYEPDGKVERIIPVAMETPKANVNIMVKKEMKYDPYHRAVMSVIEGILDLRYVETIREEEGGTYGVRVRTGMERWPLEKGTLQIRFDCDPERADDLKGIIYEELSKLAENGPSQEDLSKTVENLLKVREQNKEHNSYVLGTLYNFYIHGINFDDPANYEDILNGLKTEDVRRVMSSLYDDPNLVDVVFVPKEAAMP